jgi:hypothetical protein
MKTLATLVLAAAIGAVAAAPASAASTYCSPSGDLCYGAMANPPVRLNITLMAEYFKRYRICVTGPDGERDCKRFRIRQVNNGLWVGKVRWARHFPNRGRGTYKVRWFGLGEALGPPVTFRR